MGQESSHELVDDDTPPRTLKSRTIESVAQHIKDGKATRIVVLTGAGVSTSAGIPDFRSPETGLYANLAKLDLPYAEAVFDISYFRNNPNPFYALAHELYPGKFRPTVAHAFIALLAKKELLHMLFTQNIDCLERVAGVPGEKIVEAHGSFATQRCIECKTEFPDDMMKAAIANAEVPHCTVPQCNGLVKPDIVFFGEPLPDSFRENSPKISQANLVLILGTSLSVQPFASLPGFVLEGVPRVLINLERVGGIGSRPDDVCILSDCDEGIRHLADALGWRKELEALWKEVSGKKDSQDAVTAPTAHKTKDEVLEDEIEKLTKEVDHTLKLSNGHKQWLENHLGDKVAKGPALREDVGNTTGSKDSQSAGSGKEPGNLSNPYDLVFKGPPIRDDEENSISTKTDQNAKAADEPGDLVNPLGDFIFKGPPIREDEQTEKNKRRFEESLEASGSEDRKDDMVAKESPATHEGKHTSKPADAPGTHSAVTKPDETKATEKGEDTKSHL
jgi:NAD-dependent histone deacetylase SIR2